jgi:hypothetical protein
MIFIVSHKHTAQMCPAGKVNPDKEFFLKLSEQIEGSGVQLIDGYVDVTGHEIYLFLETDDMGKLNLALEQLRKVGDHNKIAPIMPFSKAVEWAVQMNK